MKFFLLAISLFFYGLVFGQTELKDIPALNSGLGRTPEQRLRRSQEIIEQVKKIAMDHGLQVKEIRLSRAHTPNYSALQILPYGQHVLNQEAARIDRGLYGLPLIFSPFDLSSGSNAFFDPNGSKLGVPYDFFVHGFNSSSYQHELLHAGTYAQLIAGRNPFWAGLVKLNHGSFVSETNQSYYFRFASQDEILATALSIQLDSIHLKELHRTQSPAEFNDFHGKASAVLNEIYFSALAGQALARQTQALALEALSCLESVKVTEEALALGRYQRKISVAEFRLPSFERVFNAGRGSYQRLADGTTYRLYFSSKPTLSQIESKLQAMSQKAQRAYELFRRVEKTISVKIEYPEIQRTSIDQLLLESGKPYQSLQ